MSGWIIALVALLYLVILFVIGYGAERSDKAGKSLVNNPYVYTLSLTVFCTAWTYYGSVGQAAGEGLYFLTTYLGPTLAAPLFLIVLRKMIRISQQQHITTIADFISARYGKNFSLGVIVALLCVIGIVPYIAVQLKAISGSMEFLMAQNSTAPAVSHTTLTLAVTVVLAVFTVLFGTRSIDASERHQGMVAAVTFEAVVKLLAFLAAGIFVVYFLFNGWGDVFAKAAEKVQLPDFTLNGEHGFLRFTVLTLLSFLAFLFLPRQFQVGVVENLNEKHLFKATWLLPLYLFLITLFVLPVAVAGLLLIGGNASSDLYVLALSAKGSKVLAMVVAIGGFSAATSMIIVETIALSTMLSNNIVMPLALLRRSFTEAGLSRLLMRVRRFSILFIVLAAFLFERVLGGQFSLVSVGLISFAAVAQFAPALLGGMYWKFATRKAAIAAILAGFAVWAYTLVIPLFAGAGYLPASIITDGPAGMELLSPQALFGLRGLDPVTHSVIWSLLFNVFTYVVVSLFTSRSDQEIVQAEFFVSAVNNDEQLSWKRTASLADLQTLLSKFLGETRARILFQSYAAKHQINITGDIADPRLVGFSERMLSGVIGNASAHIAVQSVVKEEKLSTGEIIDMLQETQQVRDLNRALKRKQDELTRATDELRRVNEQLREMDEMKDEFLYTVTHELRTPLTSIRALAEIVHDNADMDEQEREQYLNGIVRESERLSYLITQVLKLERYESGRHKLYAQPVNIVSAIGEVAQSVKPLAAARNVTLNLFLPDSMLLVQADKDMLVQVIYNLVTNAIKFADAQHGTVNVRLFFDDTEARVMVEDNGKGVEPELRELIFDKFFQARNQTLKKPEGSGLGLAISKRIIEMHGGRIWAEQVQGSGARFIFVLPI
ncbi:MAG: ATP-binding protein [Bacteroidia bacterium]|jgi:Na+/proline symporter/nitrogen-specific signal transduction histidine kinase|nr:ATP-binding protein [Bacteroidia bacterium]